MRRWMLRSAWPLALALLVLGPPSNLNGQVPWDTPILIGPGSPDAVSLFLIDPGEGVGFLALWHGGGTDHRYGFRAGFAEDHAEDLVAFGGVDFSGDILSHSEEFPLDLIWLAGAGLSVGDQALLSIPMGVSMGRVLDDGDLRFHPYVAPRLVLDAYLGDDPVHSHDGGEPHRHIRDDTDLAFVLDIGADFSPSGSWAIRFGASLGDREGLAIGFSFPGWR